MKVRDLPFTRSIAERNATLYDLSLGMAARTAVSLVEQHRFIEAAIYQPRLEKRFTEAVLGLGLTATDTLVQVGANDGKHDDPISHLLDRISAHVLLVEPIGIAFDALQKRHKDRPNIQLANSAISRSGQDISLFVPRLVGQELMGSLWTCPSEHQARAEAMKYMNTHSKEGLAIDKVTLPTMTAAQLLCAHAIDSESIAVLVCDTEGQDVDICQSFFDAGAKPNVLHYEQLHVDRDQGEAFKDQLTGFGYELMETRKDVLAIQ